MRFLAKKNKEVTCRLCKQTFCCKQCCYKHEEKYHLVLPECDICIYGVIPISHAKLSSTLLDHIKEKHWPLHCVHCQQVYNHIEDLEKHGTKCPKLDKMCTKTPKRDIEMEVGNFESPPIMPLPNMPRVTSTPMNPDVEINLEVPAQITPVDGDRISSDCGLSTINSETATSTTKNSKKVTFYSTPSILNVRKKPKNQAVFFKSSLKNSLLKNINNLQSSGKVCDLRRRSDSFSTAHEFLANDPIEELQEVKQEIPEDLETTEEQLFEPPVLNQNDTNNLEKQTENAKDQEVQPEIIPTEPISVKVESQDEEVEEQPVTKQPEAENSTKKRRSMSMNETLWQSALNDTAIMEEIDEDEEKVEEKRSKSLNIEIKTENPELPNDSDVANSLEFTSNSSQANVSSEKVGVWTSMTSLIKNVVQGFSSSELGDMSEGCDYPLKRHRSLNDYDIDMQKFKRMKLGDVKCRPPIRSQSYMCIKVDKAVQTEDIDNVLDY